jgi:hypothetical protein
MQKYSFVTGSDAHLGRGTARRPRAGADLRSTHHSKKQEEAMSKKAKMTVAAVVAAISLGGLAPVVQAAPADLGRDIDRVMNRDVPRVTKETTGLTKQVLQTPNSASRMARDAVQGALDILR